MHQAESVTRPTVKSVFIWRVSLIAGLGGILYGCDMGIIAAALSYVRTTFALSTKMEESSVSPNKLSSSSLWDPAKTARPNDLQATRIFDEAIAGDQLAKSVLDRSARTLAYDIYNISLILNCTLFVLGGGVGIHPAICEATREVLKERGSRAVPRFVLRTPGRTAQLTGAI